MGSLEKRETQDKKDFQVLVGPLESLVHLAYLGFLDSRGIEVFKDYQELMHLLEMED